MNYILSKKLDESEVASEETQLSDKITFHCPNMKYAGKIINCRQRRPEKEIPCFEVTIVYRNGSNST